jgi:hypothetical protein
VRRPNLDEISKATHRVDTFFFADLFFADLFFADFFIATNFFLELFDNDIGFEDRFRTFLGATFAAGSFANFLMILELRSLSSFASLLPPNE